MYLFFIFIRPQKDLTLFLFPFQYIITCCADDVAFDIRDLISVDDVMDELQLGPNGSLVYCMEYLLENMDWFQEHLDEYDDDEYLIIDCPGQIELYTHIPVMNKIIDQ